MAQQTAGPVADVGCGPGHITNFLRGLGLDIFGVDNSPVLLDVAHRVYPDLRFEIGQLASLPIATASLRGVISRHSLIHTPVDLVPAALDEIARVLAPDGVLFLSFFGCADPDAHGERFDHAVATAYQLDVDRTAELLDVAGFSEEVRVVQQPRAGERQLPHGTLIARRRS
ncbi:MAG: class I SAM-dependent methyltransferase [Ilumatobacter sp.]